MSASSNSSVENERIAARLQLMCANGSWEIFEDTIGNTDELDAFCLITKSSPSKIPGFSLQLKKQHRTPEKLGHFVGRLLKKYGLPGWLGMVCRPDSMVGGRICQTDVPDTHDFFFIRAELAESKTLHISDQIKNCACSVFGLGHLPLIGATAASLVVAAIGLVLSAALAPVAWTILMLSLALIATTLCAWLEHWAHRYYLAEDPREVVLDEVAGMSVTLAIVGPYFWLILAAFFAFRFFDIFKPGIHWIEERGWCGVIVWDDVVAGAYAGITVVIFTKISKHIVDFIFS